MKKHPPSGKIGRARLQYKYQKSNYFRVIHADGFWGGVTPQLNIHMVAYSEGIPIPDVAIHEVIPGQGLGDEIQSGARKGLIREMEADVVFDVAVAKALIEWLQDKVGTIEKAIAKATKSEEGEQETPDDIPDVTETGEQI
jgi:hypothetical protein